MNKQNTEHEGNNQIVMMLVLIIICATIIAVLIRIFIIPTSFGYDYTFNENSTRLTYEKCCDGHFCTDIFYNEKTNLCVLTLCEGNLFTNKENCYYEPND